MARSKSVALLINLSVTANLIVSAQALAQNNASPTPVNTDATKVSPEVQPESKPLPSAPAFSGPFGVIAEPLAARGITVHALGLNLFEANPSLGISKGHSTNSLYIYAGVDADLGKLAGLPGFSLHYENVFFPLTRNLNIAGQIGDSKVGYEPAFTPRLVRLSRATMEYKNSKIDLELGITHPAYYYAPANCDVIAACFQHILYINGGFTSYSFAVPGGNISYNITPNLYIQAGAFAVEPGANFHNGFDISNYDYTGALAMAEIGTRNTFANQVYPYNASLTVNFNSSPHQKVTAATALTGVSQTEQSNSGLVAQGNVVVWRRDGGNDPASKAPTALKLYTSVGISTDPTTPIRSDMFAGATLLSPIQGRSDRVGIQVSWERLSSSFTRYLTTANQVAGGPGFLSPYGQDTVVLQGHGHIQLPFGTALEPIVQYGFSPNSYYNPSSPKKASAGVYIGANFVVPLGSMLGLQAN